MTLATGALWNLDAAATAGNVNAGYFNPTNANFLTDWVVDANTGNTTAPVVSTPSYNAVAGDNGAYWYLKSGTGYYTLTRFLITSSTSPANKFTLNGTIGAASTYSATMDEWLPSTTQGVSSSASPGNALTAGVDYSKLITAKVAAVTDFNSTTISPLNLTSATAAFTPVMPGNGFHQTTTGTGAFGVVGWYEIVSYTNATTVVLDRTPNNGTASVNTTGYIGGAQNMGALDDALFEAFVAGNFAYVKLGTYSIGAAISVGTGIGTAANVIKLVGYQTVPGDEPMNANRPTFASGASAMTLGVFWWVRNTMFTGTAATMLTAGASGRIINCKGMNQSTNAARTGISVSTSLIFNNEFISYRGIALTSTSVQKVYGNYIHSSDIGIRNTASDTSSPSIQFNVVISCVTAAIQITGAMTGNAFITNNVLYGAENKLGIGFSIATGATLQTTLNNIFYGFVTGVSAADTATQGYDDYNDYFNNTADVSAVGQWQKGMHDMAVNPGFTSVGQVTFATATTSGTTLTQSAADFTASGVVAGRDYLQITGGTGLVLGYYGITAVGTTTLTVDTAFVTNATANTTGQITIGRNLGIGSALRAAGFPGIFPGGLTTGYLDIGAAQRREPTSYSHVVSV